MLSDNNYLFSLFLRSGNCLKALQYNSKTTLSLTEKAHLIAIYATPKCITSLSDSKIKDALAKEDSLTLMIENDNLALFRIFHTSSPADFSLFSTVLKHDKLLFLDHLIFSSKSNPFVKDSNSLTPLKKFEKDNLINNTSAFLNTVTQEKQAISWEDEITCSFESKFADVTNRILKTKLQFLNKQHSFQPFFSSTDLEISHKKALEKVLFNNLLNSI